MRETDCVRVSVCYLGRAIGVDRNHVLSTLLDFELYVKLPLQRSNALLMGWSPTLCAGRSRHIIWGQRLQLWLNNCLSESAAMWIKVVVWVWVNSRMCVCNMSFSVLCHWSKPCVHLFKLNIHAQQMCIQLWAQSRLASDYTIFQIKYLASRQ